MKKKVIIVFTACFCIICGIFVSILSRYQNTSAERLPDQYDGKIEQIHNSADLLGGALNYIALKPKYKSKYYETGYPNDKYGVCTDVVANALKYAGYDLMKLVQTDIAAYPSAYDIEEPDAKIDFRRVKNLKVYFEHTALSLTTDVFDIEEWQGGDIVIFKKHIGIVSDRRNGKGIPYVIHHNDPWQARYEEDILESYGEIVGHYRIKFYHQESELKSGVL